MNQSIGKCLNGFWFQSGIEKTVSVSSSSLILQNYMPHMLEVRQLTCCKHIGMVNTFPYVLESRKPMSRRAPIPPLPPQETALEPITEKQQTFIESLLAGKSITASALIAGISRRTATYWLADPMHTVSVEYEKRRILQQQEFYARIANLHELALKAMEETLAPESPPALRFAAAKYIYEKHLQHLFSVRTADPPFELAKREADSEKEREYFMDYGHQHIARIPE